MKKTKYLSLQRSKLQPPGGARLRPEKPDPDQILQITVVVRSRTPAEIRNKALTDLTSQAPHLRKHLELDEFADSHGADQKDLALVKSFAEKNGLQVIEVNTERRCVVLTGRLAAFTRSFQLQPISYERENHHYLSYEGSIQIPESLQGLVEAVLGLDNRPLAEHHMFASVRHTIQHTDPRDVMSEYSFPMEFHGEGQCIAIIELGGGFYQTDIDEYFKRMRLSKPGIEVVEIDGQKNHPASMAIIKQLLSAMGQTGTTPTTGNMDPADVAHGMWTIETTMDIQLMGSFANATQIVVYFAPNNARGKYDALSAALTSKHKPGVISCSWGGVEENMPADFLHSFEQLLQDAALRGITVCFSSGDRGSDRDSNGVPRAHYPASSPYVLSCGGTHWVLSSEPLKEVVWEESLPTYRFQSGGGVSNKFQLPDWQGSADVERKTGKCGRGVPDVSGKADITRGYLMVVAGQEATMGGTSAAAPLWAGLIARLNQALPFRVGYLTPLLYQRSFFSCFRDITLGNNGDFHAVKGWDACTGLGRPIGKQLLAALSPH